MRFINKNASKKELTVNKSEKNNQSSESSTQSTNNKIKPFYDTPEMISKAKLIDNTKSKIENFEEEKLQSSNKDGSIRGLSVNNTLIRKEDKIINSMWKDTNHADSENHDTIFNQNSVVVINGKVKQIHESNRKRSMSHQNLDIYQFPSGMNSNKRNSEFEVDKPSFIHMKKHSELLPIQNIAKLAEINEENDSLSDQSGAMMEQSPKVIVEIKDTWGVGTPRIDDTWLEIMNDINDLELKYRLRDNWLDTKSSIDRPFTADISAIFTINDRNKY